MAKNKSHKDWLFTKGPTLPICLGCCFLHFAHLLNTLGEFLEFCVNFSILSYFKNIKIHLHKYTTVCTLLIKVLKKWLIVPTVKHCGFFAIKDSMFKVLLFHFFLQFHSFCRLFSQLDFELWCKIFMKERAY